MKDDGDLFHCLIYRALTDADIHNISHSYKSKNSDRNILERYGTDATPDNFREINLDYTPDSDLYGDDHGGGMSVGQDEEETPKTVTGIECDMPKPEANENNVNTSVMLPR